MTSPLISVVIGVYNGAAYLEETLASVLSQEGCALELVVVDDGSRDESPRILAAMAARDPRVRVLTQANAGLTRALIRGCDAAHGEFIARQDVGDVSLPQRLARQSALLRSSPEIGFVSCAHRFLGPAGEPLTSLAQAPNAPVPGQIPNPHHGSVMIRKSTYMQAGGYRPEFYFAQDVDLWSRLIEHAGFAACPEVLYEVRFDLDGITARHRASQQALRALIEEAAKARREGKSEQEILQRAACIRPGGEGAPATKAKARRGEAAYFVGSCLAQQRDMRARGYLLEAIRQNPLHVKSWLKLLRLSLTSRAGMP